MSWLRVEGEDRAHLLVCALFLAHANWRLHQVSLTDAAEVDYDGSVGNNNHPGNKVLKVWRSSASICPV